MIKSTFLFSLLAINSFATKAQNVVLSKSELTNEICAEWRLDFLTTGEQTLPAPTELILEFLNDNSVIRKISNNEIKGNWTYDQNNKWIQIELPTLKHSATMKNNELITETTVVNSITRITNLDQQRFIMIDVTDTENNQTKYHFIKLKN
jgi:hypothetical protein